MITRNASLRDWSATAIIVALLTLLAASPLLDRLNAVSADLLLLLRHQIFGQRHAAEESPTIVIAIDEQTYRTPPFANTPKVFWTPQIATVVDAALASGAKVVGFDMVFPTTVESYLPGFERPFLISLREGGRTGRIVLGKVQHQTKPISPFPAQSMMVGNERNIRLLNVVNDVDDVARHIPLYFNAVTTGNARRRDASMALELAARAMGVEPQIGANGVVNLGGYAIPGSEHNVMRINFQGGNDVPTFSLADIYACIQSGESAAYMERYFKNKVVLIGEVLDLEDRKLTGKQLMTGPEGGARFTPCRIADDAKPSTIRRNTIPGVYIHASAVNDLIRSDALREFPRPANVALAALFALLTALLVMLLRPVRAAVAITALAVIWSVLSIGTIQAGLMLPFLPVVMTVVLTYGLMLAYRYAVVDQQKGKIRRLFGLYLAPSVVSRMVESDHLPELGGENRKVTVWFSDVANFTHLSEGLSPQELVTMMNAYFSAVTDIIESHGGFVDKYIGDAIVAVFGAPIDDPAHAENAVTAALAATKKLAEMNQSGVFGPRKIGTRIGINTGDALVGNVGSSRRFNYTVMGDTVNLASRLEGANKATGTHILIAEETAAELSPRVVRRIISRLRVKGRHAPVTVYEPLALESDTDAPRARDVAQLFEQAHRLIIDRHFADAATLLSTLPDDPAALKMRERAQELAAEPPPHEWDGVNTLTEK